jgi:phytoene synthase
VKEDALMGRVYLPADDLARFQRTAADLSPAALGNGFDVSRFRGVLEMEAFRARDFYQSANELLPLIDEDSRPALWVLVEIYRRLLEKIITRNYDVFTERVRLTTPEKLRILSRGLWRRIKE